MERITWIDKLRGISILAVIFLHCMIAVNDDAGHFTVFNTLINESLFPARMGVMFFIAGLFVDSGLKKGISRFFHNKLRSILYPYFIWVIIYGGLKFIFIPISNHPQSPLAILLSHLTGAGDITWFLHSLFIYFMLIVWVRNIPFYYVIPVCIFLSHFLPPIPEGLFSGFDALHINKSIYLFSFFYLGDALVKNKVDVIELCQRKWVLSTALSAFVLLAGLSFFSEEKMDYNTVAPLTPLALLAIPLYVFVATKINSRIINFIGENAMVFYLTHYLVIQIFAKVNISSYSPWLNDAKFILAFFAAVTFPLIICKLREHGWLNFLFTLRSQRKTPLSAQ